MVPGGLPREGEGCERRVDRHRLELEAVSTVQVGEFVGVVPLQRTGPRADLLVHQAEDRCRGMQCEVPTQRRQVYPGAQQQRGGMDRAAGDHRRPRPHPQGVWPDARFDADRVAAFQDHPPDLAVHDDPRPAVGCVLEVRDKSRLLGAAAAAEAAVAALVVLRAAPRVARQEAVVPFEAIEAADQYLVAPAGPALVGVHVDAPRHGVE